MDKMREELELAYVMRVCGCDAERATKRIKDMDGEGMLARHSEAYDYKYCQQSTDDAWWAWQASRAALCVNLNGIVFSKDKDGGGWLMLSERVFNAMDDAGVRYE